MSFLLLSFRERLQHVWHAPIVEAETAVVDSLGAAVVSMQSTRLSTFRYRELRRRFDPVPPVRLAGVPNKRASVGVVIFPTGSIISDLVLVKGWEELAEQWVAVVHEVWPATIDQSGDLLAEVLGRFAAVAVMTKAGADELNRRYPSVRARFAPFALDATVLTHRPAGRRGVALFNPGRRDPIQHTALQSALADSLYLFDTFSPGPCPDLSVHRANYLRTINHSQMMMTNYAKFDSAERGQHIEVGLRITEALGGGAVPIGHHPAAIEMDGLDRTWFGPFIPVGSAVAMDVVDDVLRDTDHRERVAFEGPRFVALHHDWSHRIAELLVRAEIEVPATLTLRQDQLRARWSG